MMILVPSSNILRAICLVGGRNLEQGIYAQGLDIAGPSGAVGSQKRADPVIFLQIPC
jgi:hypothetical protein